MNTRRTTLKHRTGRRKAPTKGLALSNNPTGMLALMCLFLFAVVAAYWHTTNIQFDIKGFRFTQNQAVELSDEMRASLNQRHINRKFIIGGVQLGMTQHMVQEIHENAEVTVDRAGEPVILIPTEKGLLVAWLKDIDTVIDQNGGLVKNTTARIYRLRLDEAFATLSEADILNRYSREYGRPIDTDCARAGQGDTPRCTYRWWGGDGIEVQAIAKKKADINGRDYTQLTTIATNTITSPKSSIVSLSNLSGTGRWGYVN